MNRIDLTDYPHPAIAEVSHTAINRAALEAAHALALRGFWQGEIEPGDSTRYDVVIARRADSDQWVVASNLGVMYPWNGNPTVHPDYATEHYSVHHSSWTGVVMALFLNATADRLHVIEGTPA